MCGAAHAQDRLSLSADTLFYPHDDHLYASNETESAIVLDSVSIRFAGQREWSFEVVGRDTSLVLFGLSPAYDSTAAVDLLVEPDDSVEILVTSYDPCIVCKKTFRGSPSDTLFVYSGGVDQPATVLLDATGHVSVEQNALGAEAPMLHVFPNPASRAITIGTAPGEAWRATLHDLLGREVLSVYRFGGGRRTLDVGNLAPGIYMLRARLSDSRLEFHSVVIAR